MKRIGIFGSAIYYDDNWKIKIFALVLFFILCFIFFIILLNHISVKIDSEKFMLYKPYDSIVEDDLVYKYHEKFVHQIEWEGYTYRTLEIADEVIEYYKTHEIDDIFIYVDYIIYPAEFCILQENYKKADEYLEHISAQTFIDNFADDRNTEFTPYKYWALKMEVLRGLDDELDTAKGVMDESEAEKLIGTVEKYWDEDLHKDDNNHFWKDVCHYHYHMLRNEYSKAAEYADNLTTYSSNNKTGFIACILNAEVMFHMKKKENSRIMMQLAKEMAQKNKAHVRQQYRKRMRKYVFTR